MTATELKLAEEPASDTAVREHLSQQWEFEIVRFRDDAALLTSDSPSLWLSASGAGNRLCGVILPLTPLGCFVGVHRGTYIVSSNFASATDASVVNHKVIENCVDGVYCSEALTPDQITRVRHQLRQRQSLGQPTNAWGVEFIDYDRNPNLTFLKSRR